MEDKLMDLIAEALEIDKSRLSLDTRKSELEEWDSLAHLIILSMVESELNIRIPFEKANEINKIGDFLQYVK
ncbi:MAG TPA: acyl carrier protein [Bacillota bacterium]|nr:acyl carrier protein [Bacillota bacterium]HQI17324.1 acyl carrier protein [Bacillota bacterium]HQJ36382.1 acyl carrier protein [Bacillota bacterium]HRS20527.1 acyl carrier protein [Clostridia bacterium]